MTSNRPTQIAVIGGSGNWANRTHHPAILQAKAQGIAARLAVVVDPVCPSTPPGSASLSDLFSVDRPEWLDVTGLSLDETHQLLDRFILHTPLDLAVIATDPEHHSDYVAWALRHRINVVCDKPLVAMRGAASNGHSANAIGTTFDELIRLSQQAGRSTFVALPLRRRALTPYVTIAKKLKDAFAATGQGVTHMHIVINNGIHRFPPEFAGGGSHGYLSGFGSLSHTGYHYLDLIAWYLSSAPGSVKALSVSAPYVFRVRDYLQVSGYSGISSLCCESTSAEKPLLSAETLAAELDCTFMIRLLDRTGRNIGLVTLSCNNTTYSPRTLTCPPLVRDPANSPHGGRMSHTIVDVQQGPIQSFTVQQNHPSHAASVIDFVCWSRLESEAPVVRRTYHDAYREGTTTLEDVLVRIIGLCSDSTSRDLNASEHLTFIDDQQLTMQLYATCYRLIAQCESGCNEDIIVPL